MLTGLTAGVAVILHEVAHRVVARHFGATAHFVANDGMLILSILIAFAGFLFAAPGAVWHSGWLTQTTKRSGGGGRSSDEHGAGADFRRAIHHVTRHRSATARQRAKHGFLDQRATGRFQHVATRTHRRCENPELERRRVRRAVRHCCRDRVWLATHFHRITQAILAPERPGLGRYAY